MQDVIHCLLNRIRYLDNQIPCIENKVMQSSLQTCLVMLEKRAADRHGVQLECVTLEQLEMRLLCPLCGHTFCTCVLD
jgi:hypothetical protein